MSFGIKLSLCLLVLVVIAIDHQTEAQYASTFVGKNFTNFDSNTKWITFGTTYSLEGALQQISSGIILAYEFFVTWANGRGGLIINETQYYFRIKWYDDASILDQYPILFESLIVFEKVDILLSPAGTVGNLLSQVAAKYEKILWLNGGYLILEGTNATWSYTNVGTVDVVVSECLKLFQNHSIKTAAVITSQGAAQFNCEAAKDLPLYGINVTYLDEYPPTVDYDTLAKKIKTYNPDLVFGGGPSDAIEVTSALYLNDIKTQYLSLSLPLQAFNWSIDYGFSIALWSVQVGYSDEYFGTATDFQNTFLAYTGFLPTWFSAALVVAPLISMIVINETQSIDPHTLNNYLSTFSRTLYYGAVNFNNTNHCGGSVPLCIQYIPNTDTPYKNFIVSPQDKQVREPIFGETPPIPAYLIPKPHSDTDFLLSVILGTTLPVIFLIVVGILLFFVIRKTFDIIVLPKQEKHDWGI